MAERQTIKVSPILQGDANYKALTDIPSVYLTKQNLTVVMYPGEYAAPTAAVYDNVAFVGVGDREEILINGDMTIANTSANVISFENIKFVSSNSDVESNTFCVTKLGIGKATLKFTNCTFSNAEDAISSHAALSLSGGENLVQVDYCDASAMNSCIVANSNAKLSFTQFGSGAYMRPHTGSPTVTSTVLACSGGANTGNMTEVVTAVIS